ncbi:spore germination protein GerW family protein [Nonomuraea sp. NPDC050556]|uniref:spore germination protein GerW family protein n=1 Tax=Nonomuraea sp. NPDC050556 TaxID=3364369 RepID=UPI0037A6CD3D
MNIMELLEQTKDQATVGRVFGEPITRGDVTIIPVAKVAQGGGGGMGTSKDKEFEGGGGSGGGFGIAAKPAGIYVVKDGEVHWKPAVDVNRIVIGGQIVGVILLLTIRAAIKVIARRKRK